MAEKKANSRVRTRNFATVVYPESAPENWQEILADRWVNIIFNNKNLKSNEPWFNNALREFTISLLEKYDNLSNEEQNNLKFDLSTLIEEYKDKEVNNVSNKFI